MSDAEDNGPAKTAFFRVKPNSLAGKNVIITGEVEGYARNAALQFLLEAGATAEKSLNKKVNLVVLGNDPGPKKLDKIRQMGIEMRQWEDVLAEIRLDGVEEPETDDEPMEESKKEKPVKKKLDKKGPVKKEPVKEEDPKTADPPSIFGSGGNPVQGKTVIITGTIPGYDRKAAGALLEDAGATIAKSLNKSVELVILGTNPGPDKLNKIEDMGITTIAWKELANEIGVEAEDDEDDEPPPPVKTVDAPTEISGKTLLITGAIDGHTRSSAQKLLEGAGAKFAKSLNKQVELVVLGANPGPDKMKSIADMGIGTVKWEDLVEGLGLPEGGEPPKKKSKKG